MIGKERKFFDVEKSFDVLYFKGKTNLLLFWGVLLLFFAYLKAYFEKLHYRGPEVDQQTLLTRLIYR